MPPRVPSGRPFTCVCWLPGPARVRLAAGPRVGTAHRAHRERARRDHVLLDERRRDLQAARDVVEVHDLLVLRQELGRVDLEREQLVNRVRVFLAVEPVRDDRGECVPRSGRRVQRLLEPRDERHQPLLVGARLFRRRHQVAAQLAHGLLERFGVLGHVRGPDLLEVDAARELGGVVAIRAVLVDDLPLLAAGCSHRRVVTLLRAPGEQGKSGEQRGVSHGVWHPERSDYFNRPAFNYPPSNALTFY